MENIKTISTNKVVKPTTYNSAFFIVIMSVLINLIASCSTSTIKLSTQDSNIAGQQASEAICIELSSFMNDYNNNPTYSFQLLGKKFGQMEAVNSKPLLSKIPFYTVADSKCLDSNWKPDFCSTGYGSYITSYKHQKYVLQSYDESSYMSGYNNYKCNLDVTKKIIGFLIKQQS